MKGTLTFVCVSLFALASLAANCSVNVPGVSVDSAVQNFDGSCYYTNPRVSVDGNMLQVTSASPAGACALFGQNVVTYDLTTINSDGAILTDDGQLAGINSDWKSGIEVAVISSMVCN